MLSTAMGLPDWNLPEWLSVIGFPAVGLGLLLAWRQANDIRELAKAARDGADSAAAAAQAAERAISRTEARIADQNLLMLLHQVHKIADSLDLAPRPEDVLRVCSEWISLASELKGLISGTDPTHNLIEPLSASIEMAGVTKNAIIEKREDPAMASRELREALVEIRSSASMIVGRMRAYTLEEPNA